MTGLVERLRRLVATTPGRYRVWSVGLAALLILTAIAGALVGATMASSTDRLRSNTGPVLVATQDVVASLAEADAAASAAFLSGTDEDPEARRSYEQALERASRQLEEVSSLIGDDERAHDALGDLGVLVTRYAGLVESARALQASGATAADERLVEALDLLGAAVGDRAADLTAATEERLADDAASPVVGVAVAVALAALAVAALVAVQLALARRTRRLVNPGLLLATVLVVVAGGWLLAGHLRARADLDDARVDGYESIVVTAGIQVDGQRARTDETVALITGDRDRLDDADEAAGRLTDRPVTDDAVTRARAGEDLDLVGRLGDAAARADSPRERAATAELLVRWQRYAEASERLRGASAEEARAIAVGPAAATFTGFNAAVESVLGDNRAQLLDGFEAADGHVGPIALVALVLPLVAAVCALGGLQLRIAEYR